MRGVAVEDHLQVLVQRLVGPAKCEGIEMYSRPALALLVDGVAQVFEIDTTLGHGV